MEKNKPSLNSQIKTEEYSNENDQTKTNEINSVSKNPIGVISNVNSTGKKTKSDKKAAELLKSLSDLPTPDEKLAVICKKYAEQLEENKLISQDLKATTKKLTIAIKEKDHAQTEHSKAVLAKGQFEGLCRELQRRCKDSKDETLREVRIEEDKRKKIVETFQSTIAEVQSQINSHQEANMKLRDDNIKLTEQLKNLIEQYTGREKHVDEILKHRDLERQLMEAKEEQMKMTLLAEQEEKQKLTFQMQDQLKRIALMEEHEKQLKAQIHMYTSKYEEFQGTLTNSNDILKTFKNEMESMTKRMKKMDKEANMWKTRCENSNKTLIEMAEIKTKQDEEIVKLRNKIIKLENLSRALQAERNQLAEKNKHLVSVKEEINNKNDTNVNDNVREEINDENSLLLYKNRVNENILLKYLDDNNLIKMTEYESKVLSLLLDSSCDKDEMSLVILKDDYDVKTIILISVIELFCKYKSSPDIDTGIIILILPNNDACVELHDRFKQLLKYDDGLLCSLLLNSTSYDGGNNNIIITTYNCISDAIEQKLVSGDSVQKFIVLKAEHLNDDDLQSITKKFKRGTLFSNKKIKIDNLSKIVDFEIEA